MDQRITVTYCIQSLAGLAGGLSAYFLMLNVIAGKPAGVLFDCIGLLIQYWVFCRQGALRDYIKEQNKWRKKP